MLSEFDANVEDFSHDCDKHKAQKTVNVNEEHSWGGCLSAFSLVKSSRLIRLWWQSLPAFQNKRWYEKSKLGTNNLAFFR